MATEQNGRTVLNKPLEEGEPCFILRGNDILAAETVEGWIRLAEDMGVRPTTIEAARRILQAMHAWPIERRKLPD